MIERITFAILNGILLLAISGCGAGDVPSAEAEQPAPKDGQPRSAAAVADSAPLKDIGTRRQGVDWPVFLGPTGDSKSPEMGILTEWPETGPRVVWQRELNTGYGVGTVSKGRMYHFERVKDRAKLICLNSETGEEIWNFEYTTNYEDLYGYNNGPRCSPIVDGNRVYIFGAEGMLHCLTAGEGKLIWKADTSKRFGVVQNFFGVGSSPVVHEGLLLVMVGGSPAEDQTVPPGSLDQVTGAGSGIVAFDKLTGEVKYKISDELASYAGLKLATIDGRKWCFAFARGGLVGFEPTKGKVDFHYPWRARILESVNASTPVVVGNQVFISETYGPGSSLLSVRPGGFDVVWSDDPTVRDKAMQTHWNTAIHHNGYVYGSSGRHTENAELRCIELKTGEVKWSVPRTTRTSLMYADGHFVVLGEYGHLWLIKANPERHEIVAKIEPEDADQALLGEIGRLPQLRYPCWAAPILSHGLLYVRGDDQLVCLELIPKK